MSIFSDGNAVEVTLTETREVNDLALEDGFVGTLMKGGSSGDIVAMEIQQRELEVEIPGELTGAKGSILYMNIVTGVITETDTDRKILRITEAKDANNYVHAILLAQNN